MEDSIKQQVTLADTILKEPYSDDEDDGNN